MMLPGCHIPCMGISFFQVLLAGYVRSPKLETRKNSFSSRTLDVKQNFKNQKQNAWCISCGLFHENQGSLLQYSNGQTVKLNVNLIYDRIDQHLVIVNIYSDIINNNDVFTAQPEQ